MISVVLIEPEIPPNTGNIARTCAATGVPLHLVKPLGFSISDRHVRRAGLDYWSDLDLHVHEDSDAFFAYLSDEHPVVTPRRAQSVALLTTKGKQSYTDIPLDENLFILFGPETRGLSDEILARYPERRYRIPMMPDQRSLNLSNSVAVVVYDLLRRQGFDRFV